MPSPDERLLNAPTPVPRQLPRRFLAFLRGVFAVFTLFFVAAAAVGGVVGWTVYQSYTTDLPSLDGLRTYQPRVMSRIYAGDDHLVAELATERRIFVPFAAIPDVVKRAFIAAEDKNFFSA
jgi:penicillin-binding protein 1A